MKKEPSYTGLKLDLDFLQREKLGIVGRVSEIYYTNIYHMYGLSNGFVAL